MKRSRHSSPVRAASLLAAIVLVALAVLSVGRLTALSESGWVSQESGTSGTLRSVSAVDANTAWAVSLDGEVLKTSNGGVAWELQSVEPGTDFRCVEAVTADTAWVVADAPARVFKTSDGGQNWDLKFQYTSAASSMYAITAVDEDTAWATGVYYWYPYLDVTDWNAVVLKTTDGGTSWTAQYTVNKVVFNGISAANANVAWLVGPNDTWPTNSILKTTDGGASWAPQSTGGKPSQFGVHAVSENVVWTCGTNGTVFRTVNGGAVWENKLTLNSYTGLISISACDANVAWAVGVDGNILKTNDGGVTWLVQRTGPASQLYSVSAVDANTAWAVGEGGVILKTTDGGGSSAPPMISKLLSDSPAKGIVTVQGLGFGTSRGSSFVSFGSVPVEDYISWSEREVKAYVPLGAGSGTYPVTVTTPVATSNTMNHRVVPWFNQIAISGGWFDVAAADGSTAWAVGTMGKIIKTSDGGGTWVQQTSGTGETLMSVSAADTHTAWAAGANSALLKTTDGGASWTRQTTPVPCNFYTVSAADGNAVWAAGEYSGSAVMLSTTDGGASWHQQAPGAFTGIRAVCAADADNVWAVGIGSSASHLLRSTDGGSVWSETESVAAYLTDIAAADAQVVWSVGTGGTVVNTKDGGASWLSQSSGTTRDIGGVAAVDENTAWAVGDEVILKTGDGGGTWSPQLTSTIFVSARVNSVAAADANTAWAVGVYGTVLHTIDGGAGRPIPVLSSTSPGAGGPDTEVSIKGSGFWWSRGSSYVSFGTVAATDYTYWGPGEIRCRVPVTAAGDAPVTVTNIYGSSNALPFSVGATAAPVVSTIAPASAVNNSVVSVEITGRGFAGGATARLELAPTVVSATDVVAVSDTKITCKVDLSGKPLGKYDVIVRNPDGQEARLAKAFSVTDICGQGAAASISVFAGLLGLLYLAGSTRPLRRKKL